MTTHNKQSMARRGWEPDDIATPDRIGELLDFMGLADDVDDKTRVVRYLTGCYLLEHIEDARRYKQIIRMDILEGMARPCADGIVYYIRYFNIDAGAVSPAIK